MSFFTKKSEMPSPEDALPGRDQSMPVAARHALLGTPMTPPFADFAEVAIFGLGCFWGAERRFWQQAGVITTAVGYSAGYTPNPTYEEVCSGFTGHNEVVLVVFDPEQITYQDLLKVFWESHNPTQGMRQGNDRGTQYRSGIYTCTDEQASLARQSLEHYQQRMDEQGLAKITTEIMPASEFYYAEDYHQQYLHKNPGGYCGLGGTGVRY